jgi:G6PDH family F420-dependent oxidoreductase
MTQIGYFLSCEQFGPRDLIDQAKRTEDAGCQALWISDHYHPWNDEQGQSPFVWGVIGALSEATTLPGVDCGDVSDGANPSGDHRAGGRDCGVQLDGRFVLGVGTGEALNEHILGDPWPSVGLRLEMLEEAIAVIRLLHGGIRGPCRRRLLPGHARRRSGEYLPRVGWRRQARPGRHEGELG